MATFGCSQNNDILKTINIGNANILANIRSLSEDIAEMKGKLEILAKSQEVIKCKIDALDGVFREVLWVRASGIAAIVVLTDAIGKFLLEGILMIWGKV